MALVAISLLVTMARSAPARSREGVGHAPVRRAHMTAPKEVGRSGTAIAEHEKYTHGVFFWWW
jgi:hypothetical protein